MGDTKYEIPEKAIETFKTWNGELLKHHKAYDKLMVEALLLIFVNPEDLAKGLVNDTVRGFIRDLLEVRVNQDLERMGNLDEYIADVCNEKPRKKQGPYFALEFTQNHFFKVYSKPSQIKYLIDSILVFFSRFISYIHIKLTKY